MVPLSSGVLLIANPELPDPNFDRTVLLILAHGHGGSLGVVLNRPGTLKVADHLSEWDSTLVGDGVVFDGGPVNKEASIGLGVRNGRSSGALPEAVMSEVFPDVGIVDLTRPPDEDRRALCALRVFVGYAGWSPGQLMGEVESGGWWIVTAQASDVTTDRPRSLWRDVLRRQRGSLALVSSYSKAPELN
ncbi:MAG: YqgE/AlgH family protein [Actinomycetota bacterium]|nr:YqgE/AlgH family protein [Actinomycetota bacterium]